MDEMFNRILEKIEKSGRQYDLDMITRAYELAKKAHEGQKRVSGEPYIIHPMSVAEILVDYGMDSESIAAAFLHDVVEDCDVTSADIKKNFGSGVAYCVEGVTKLGKIPFTTREEEQVENIRKMLLAMAKDIRVIIIKLADRLHNMRTLGSMPEKKQRDIAFETMCVFAPLAHRLGMQRMKWELEDLGLRYLDPIGYEEVTNQLNSTVKEGTLESIMARIDEHLKEQTFEAHLNGRVKHVYSVYRKMYGQSKSIEEIYDLYAVRIIVDSIADCYNILGAIHEIFTPIPGRFKDYISTPKPNMYQSLHTTVMGRLGTQFEVQIRTWDMHRTAEYGIAAHWKYKDGVASKDSLDNKLEWVKSLIEMQADSGTDDFLDMFKVDLFADDVFVFTPKGDVVNLPAGATVIDFAYAIHSAVGNKMTGAKIEGRIVPLDTQLENGKIVEIITSNASKGPSRDWVKIAKTGEAKNKIRQWFKKERREENIERGRTEMEREVRRLGGNVTLSQLDDVILTVAKRCDMKSIDDLYAAIGYGGLTVNKVITRIRDEITRTNKVNSEGAPLFTAKPRKVSGGIVVEGLDNCLVKFSRCCNPVPGDEIVGFVTRGYGVSVHKKDCANVEKTEENAERWIEVYWDVDNIKTFKAAVKMLSSARNGLILDIATTLNNMKVAIHDLHTRDMKNGQAEIYLTLEIQDVGHLRSVIAKLEKIHGVAEVKRI